MRPAVFHAWIWQYFPEHDKPYDDIPPEERIGEATKVVGGVTLTVGWNLDEFRYRSRINFGGEEIGPNLRSNGTINGRRWSWHRNKKPSDVFLRKMTMVLPTVEFSKDTY